MLAWGNIKSKMRYGGLPRLFFDALARIGITVEPYYIVLEGLFDQPPSDFTTRFKDYDVSLFTSDEMKAIAAIPGKEENEKQLLERLSKGNLCVGIKHNSNLVGFTWCDLAEFTLKGNEKPLKPDEAYLFDAYTLIPYRGKGIAPYIRYQCYQQLADMGKTKLYSVSGAFNVSSIKFKKKLKASILEKHVYIEIIRKWKYNFLIKKYSL